jgi:hypothetical protein
MRRAVSVALAVLMTVPILPWPADVSGSPPPFGIGDWTVTGNETLENRSLMLDGNLTIENGGSLTMSNSSLTVICDSNIIACGAPLSREANGRSYAL